MWKNFTKIALRIIIRQRLYSLINIMGLGISLAACVMILLWVQDEISFDRFHANTDCLYRVLHSSLGSNGVQTVTPVNPIPLAPAARDELPAVIRSSRYGANRFTFRKEGEFFPESGAFVDPDFLKMFSFPILEQAGDNLLAEPSTIIISRQMSRKYFGLENPINKSLKLASGYPLKVVGLIEDIPANSHLRFDYLLPFSDLEKMGRKLDSWNDVSWFTYLQLARSDQSATVAEEIDTLVARHRPERHSSYYLQPLTRIHLHSDFKFDMPGHGNVLYVYLFTFAAGLVLIIACFNFVNLTTARSAMRVREVGLRKVMGSGRLELVRQFMCESLLLITLSAIVAAILVALGLPVFNEVSAKTLGLKDLWSMSSLGWLLSVFLLTAIGAGSYPALFLSSIKPVRMFRGMERIGSRKSLLRKGLVVAQFSLSIFLLIGTTVIYQQLEFLHKGSLGFDQDNILYVPLTGIKKNEIQTLKREFLSHPNIVHATAIDQLPIYEGSGSSSIRWEGKDPEAEVQFRMGSVDRDLVDTLDLELVAGRFLSTEFSGVGTMDFVINETAVQAMGLDQPVGTRLFWGDHEGQIIGVIKDFQLRSLHHAIDPLILFSEPQWYNYLCLNILPFDTAGSIRHLGSVWKKINPNESFRYRFLDESISALYRAEERVGRIYGMFAGLAVLVSCLGLLGLAAYTAEQSSREIGIRKILGASSLTVVWMYTRDFAKWIIVANLVAWPAAWMLTSSWLQGFANHISLGPAPFLYSGLATLILALLTVSLQVMKMVRSNPVDSLHGH